MCLLSDVGAGNKRNFCAVYYGKTSGFEAIKGLLDRTMQLLGVALEGPEWGYSLEARDGESTSPPVMIYTAHVLLSSTYDG